MGKHSHAGNVAQPDQNSASHTMYTTSYIKDLMVGMK